MITYKNEAEIAKIRAAGRVLFEAMQEVKAAVKPGVSTYDLDQIADWAVESMANLVNNGLMAGKSGGLAPTANTTVEEAIVLVLAQYNKF